ncbi:hypothetical protein [Rugosimonospora africana]|uniref:hypothetical protein n=1 Tax=Rugosimonospora africana TaxID=556532 RepID=UPI001944C068|nr:hypothetical protein [Rugosimonospora africana]
MRIRHMLAVVVAGALAGAALAAPALAAPPPSTLTGSTSGGPNQSFALIFEWQKPPHTTGCGEVDFAFDTWPLGTVTATNQGTTCAASYFGSPPLLDRAPGKHTVKATPKVAGVPARSATYTIVAPGTGTSPTSRPSSTARPSPTAAGATKTTQSRTGTAAPDSVTESVPSVTTSDPGATASPSVSTSPLVMQALPGTGTRGGRGVLAWLLVVFGVVGLGVTGALTTLIVRRSRQVEEL